MLVLNQANSYNFANMVVTVTDNTVIRDEAETVQEVPKFNVLIPTVQAVGSTNVMELYYPGTPNMYQNRHGKPNALKYGFGPDFIDAVLRRGESGVGVYTINLRGEDATMANTVVLLKYKVEAEVPYCDEAGNPYLVDANGKITTTDLTGTPIVRDVLHVKYETVAVKDVKNWKGLHDAMNSLYNNTEDDKGYKTIPVFGVLYRGASDFGNNVYFSMNPRTQEYDGNVYYSITLFDGINTTTTDAVYSMDIHSGAQYNTSYFIETMFNQTFPTLRFMASESIEEVYELISKYAYTVDEYINGKQEGTYTAVDMFNPASFAIAVDEGSLNVTLPNAFKLAEGFDGAATADELFEKFFSRQIETSIGSVLQWKYHYIPDVGYNDATKKAIADLVTRRNRMTTATIMVGGTESFQSAVMDHQAKWYDTMPNIRQIAKCQSPMMYNEYVRRTITYPGTYFDTIALMEHFAKYSHYYQPFAGADARWTGYIDDTMMYPPEEVTIVNSLYKSRVNTIMKDDQLGGYLSDQQMNTQLTSDQTELNNAFLISSMLYDLLTLVHRNHYKFNEAEEVRMFHEAVNDCINQKYAPYSAVLSVEVYRLGTIGRAKSQNKIKVTIDMKDINKFTDVEIVLVDE